jgi:hypothetical protein
MKMANVAIDVTTVTMARMVGRAEAACCFMEVFEWIEDESFLLLSFAIFEIYFKGG